MTFGEELYLKLEAGNDALDRLTEIIDHARSPKTDPLQAIEYSGRSRCPQLWSSLVTEVMVLNQPSCGSALFLLTLW